LPSRDIFVIGASADGVQALQELVRPLPADLPAALFIVLHTSPAGGGILPRILSRAGELPAELARNGERMRHGRIYVAPPDFHLLLGPRGIKVMHGPRENGFRPGIDPLFRSAARSYGRRVVGIILSGMLDDGAFGLREIVDRGGVGLVQDPFEAAYPDMPRAALQRAPSARPLAVAAIAAEMIQLANGAGRPRRATIMSSGNAKEPKPEAAEPDPLEEPPRLESDDPETIGTPTVFTCPDCGGTLMELLEGELVRYRCHVGHAFTPLTLLDGQEHYIEDALWSALRALEESAALRRRSAGRALEGGLLGLARAYEEQADDLVERGRTIRRVLEQPIHHSEEEAEVPAGERGEA
jgi:two-component system chemotaxis response regulator CheB